MNVKMEERVILPRYLPEDTANVLQAGTVDFCECKFNTRNR